MVPVPPAAHSDAMSPQTATSSGRMTLVRARDGRLVAGVCEGIARYAGIDVTVVRLLFVAAALLGLAGILVYVAAWIMIPEAA